MLSVLPMPFGWSFYLAHVAHQTLAVQALRNMAHILNKQPVPDITRQAPLLVYAHNSNHIGVDTGEVESNRVALPW